MPPTGDRFGGVITIVGELPALIGVPDVFLFVMTTLSGTWLLLEILLSMFLLWPLLLDSRLPWSLILISDAAEFKN